MTEQSPECKHEEYFSLVLSYLFFLFLANIDLG